MRTKLTMSLLALGGLASLSFGVSMQAFRQDDPKDKSVSARTLSGCLSAGEKADEFHLTTADGGIWELTSKAVKLSDHVGHTVKVTGKVGHADMHGAKEKTKEAMNSDAKEHGQLDVTTLDMVSDSCKR